jgi:hypothetical protein
MTSSEHDVAKTRVSYIPINARPINTNLIFWLNLIL